MNESVNEEKDRHLSEEQFRRLRGRTATAVELFAWSDHLEACTSCARAATSVASVRGLVQALTRDEPAHLGADLIERLATHRADAIDRELADSHLPDCAACRDELARRTRFARRRYTWLAAAAALVLLVGGAALVRKRDAVTTPPAAATAVSSRTTLAIPRIAIELQSATSPLRGRPRNANTLEPLSPIGRVVLQDRPRFEWTPTGRAKYVVEIFDAEYRPVAVSPRLTVTQWTPPRPLPADRVLTWQVTAIDDAGSVTAPHPPMPEARFLILDRERARAIQRLEQQPRPALELGIAYAESGALAEAQQELSALIAANRDAETARDLLLQVQRVSP